MIFLDAYALIAFLVGGPASAQVRAILHEGRASITMANLVETLDVSERRYRIPVSRSMELIEPLLEGPLTAVPLDVATAARAAVLRARHYHRTNRPISLADAILLASVRQSDRLATADPDILAVAEHEAIGKVALPGQD